MNPQAAQIIVSNNIKELHKDADNQRLAREARQKKDKPLLAGAIKSSILSSKKELPPRSDCQTAAS